MGMHILVKNKGLWTGIILGAMLLTAIPAIAQDTVWVQTLDFNDITKRRDTWVFPDSSKQYRKVLMYYTLKCDPATTRDGYDCGEWDYLTYCQLYDHKGLLDSTYKTGMEFTVNGSSPDSLNFSWTATYELWREFQYFITHTATTSFDSAMIAPGNTPSTTHLETSSKTGRGQYIYRASELISAGLNPGNISGIRLNLSSLGSEVRNLRIGMKHSNQDTIFANAPHSGLQEVYHYNTTFATTGWNDLQFTSPFNWNGTDNIVLEFSFTGNITGTDNAVLSHSTAWNQAIFTTADEHCINFEGGGQFINLGPDAQSSGNSPRSIEGWAFARNFNNGGLWQAGPTGTVGKDFSLRTRTTDNDYRAQLWGSADFDVTLAGSKNSWHHYAMTYDGSVIKIYYDGQLAGQKNGNLNTGAFDIWLGRWQGSYLQGMMDEVRFWDIALSGQVIDEWQWKDVSAAHPNFANLKGDYKFNEGAGVTVSDNSANGNSAGSLEGMPWWRQIPGEELLRNFTASTSRPNIIFEQGVYSSVIDSTASMDTLQKKPLKVLRFDNPAGGLKIADNSALHPSLATDTIIVWQANTWCYTYDKISGQAIDSVWVNADSTLWNQTKEWYSPLVVYEIGRFITPYGIGLDLGPDGFTWVFDVTDYAPLFVDSVDLSAGNQQELIDMRFALIEGTPPAPIKRLNKVWGSRTSHSYRNLDDDNVLWDTVVAVDTTAEWFKVKTRFTGHGHNSDNGNYPHCCEWKDNEHFLFVNGQQAASWHIWKDPDCAQNPVYPQGGTWLGSREGWCPGDLVTENEFNITPWVSGNSVRLDYDITSVPSNNLGMGNGNYVVAMHMLQYGPAYYDLDAEIYDVIRPNNWEYYSRENPICQNAKIILRNSGADTLNSVTLTYGVSGGTPESITWNGNLGFLDTAHVILPISGTTFWLGDPDHKFSVAISNPNGGVDEYAANDAYTVEFDMPDTLPERFVIYLTTNNFPQENYYTITDINGNVVFSRTNLAAQWFYRDSLYLPAGCYTFEIWDSENDGLAYWAWPTQGNGYLSFNPMPLGPVLKSFPAEFGHNIHYSFITKNMVGRADPMPETGMKLFPNPNSGTFWLSIQGLLGEAEVEVFSPLGQRVFISRYFVNGYRDEKIDLSGLSKGIYFVRMRSAEVEITKRVMLR